MASARKGAAKKDKSFRVGRVRGDLRGSVWYLTYHEHGTRKRPRVGPDRDAARQMAAQVNAQLENSVPAALSFESVKITDLRSRWLDNHEHVARSSVQTIRRYQAATQHLLAFLATGKAPQSTANFRVEHAELFVRHLRLIRVPPNGHPHATPRPLLDKGVQFILETCRAMFSFGMRRRHSPPYAENPFGALKLDRMPIELAKPIVLFTPEQERSFLEARDDWQFPIFLTLMLTGMRPGELTHLLLPEDVDWGDHGVLIVRNKPQLGWQVKTRHERQIPMTSPLVAVLRIAIADRTAGPVFLRKRFYDGSFPPILAATGERMEQEVRSRIAAKEQVAAATLSRLERSATCRQVWRDAGAIKIEKLRLEFIRICRRMGAAHLTAPKMLRHLFATGLQDANVDLLIRNELRGHVPAAHHSGDSLGMTAIYTHTRPETRRSQLTAALEHRPAVAAAHDWLLRQTPSSHGLGAIGVKLAIGDESRQIVDAPHPARDDSDTVFSSRNHDYK